MPEHADASCSGSELMEIGKYFMGISIFFILLQSGNGKQRLAADFIPQADKRESGGGQFRQKDDCRINCPGLMFCTERIYVSMIYCRCSSGG